MTIKLSDHFTYSRLLRFVYPSVIMMIFTSIYGMVDGFFISNYAGKTAFAAINFIFPFIMILGFTGFMFGTGGTALVSKLLGEGEGQKANETFSMLVRITVCSGVILSVLGIIFSRPVARLLGASGQLLEDCAIYGSIILAFTTMFMLQNFFQSILIAAERPKLGLAATIAAGVTNMVFDFLFVGVFRWGLVGAAVATGLSETVGAVIPLIYFLGKKNDSLLHFVPCRMDWSAIAKACGNGSSELIGNISASFLGMIYNFQLMKYFGEDGVSAYGVLMYVQFVFMAIFIGYSVGSAPIVGYHFGAKNTGELQNLLKKSAILMFSLGVVTTILAYVLAPLLSKIFVGYDEGLYSLTVTAFRNYCYAFLFSGLNIYASSFFTALNNGAVSAAISFIRTLIFQTASVLLLPLIVGMNGIWYANTVAELLALILAMIFLIRKRNIYHYF